MDIDQKKLHRKEGGDFVKKTKKTTKATKTTVKKTSRKGRHGVHNALYATEHDFIIISGGGLVVLMLTVFLFLQ